MFKEVAETQNYEERRKWVKFRQDTLMLCQNLESLGFKLDKNFAFWMLKINLLNSDVFVDEYNQGSLDKSLEPIRSALRKI